MRLSEACSLEGQSVLASYLDFGLLLFNGKKLQLLCDITQSEGHVEVARKIELELSVSLPREQRATAMVVSENGARIAIVANKCVLIVSLPSDLWSASRSLLDSERLQHHYHCETHSLHPSLFSQQRGGTTVQQVRWVAKRSLPAGSGLHIAMLTGDSAIRLYSLDCSLDSPVSKTDFSPFIASANASFGGNNTYGLFNRLVSFDLGVFPSRPVVLAVDSDGGMYSCDLWPSCGGEVARPQQLSVHLPDEPIELLHMPHPSLSVFSLLCAGRHIVHLVALPADGDDHAIELFVHEHIQLAGSGSIRLSAGGGGGGSKEQWRGVYLVSSSSRVHMVDCGRWMAEYADILGGGSSEPGDCVVHTVLHVIGGEEEGDKENRGGKTGTGGGGEGTSMRGAAVAVPVRDGERDGDGRVLIACAAGGEQTVVHGFVRLYTAARPGMSTATETLPAGKKELDALFDVTFKQQLDKLLAGQKPLPSVVCAPGVGESALLSSLLAFQQSLTQHLILNKQAVQLAAKSVVSMLASLEEGEKMKTADEERWKKVFQGFISLSDRLERTKVAIRETHTRIEALFSRVLGRSPLSDHEHRMLSGLKQHQHTANTVHMRLPQLTLDAAAARRRLLGPARPFQASVGAKKFMLGKTTQDIDTLRERVQAVEKRVKEMEADA